MSKYDDILNATLDLIVEEGIQSVTFAKIFKRASVGGGTVYNYFDNKEELVNELYNRSRQQMSKRLLIGYEHAGTGIYERFKCLVQNYLLYAKEFPKEFVFIDSYSFSSSISPEVRNLDDDGGIQELLNILAEGKKQGILQDMDAELGIQVVYGIICLVARGFFIQKYPLNELQIQQTVASCWKAVKY